ncbi:MAG: SdrD B-like domain-containing protein [Patescibacteria group bacterium]
MPRLNYYIKNTTMVFVAALALALFAKPALAAEIIVDDGDAGYADTGWSVATDQGYPLGPGMDVHFTAAGDGSQTATSTPTIPTTGNYHVYVSWTTHLNRATNAPYTVNYSGGSQTFTVNQELLNDQATVGGQFGEWSGWYLLGTFAFDAGTTGNVVLKNNANEYVIADAVRFVSSTLTVPGDYPTIQAAIDAALPGDTILVDTGIYAGDINLNKNVILAASSSPVIDCGSTPVSGITVSSDGVTVDGFEIKNCNNGISGETSNSTLKNNTIHDNLNFTGSAGVGILLWGDNDDNQILNNVIYNNDRQGIFIGHCDFADPSGGCSAATSVSINNVIKGNTIHDNGLYTQANGPDASQYGIQLWNAQNNTIEENEIYNHNTWLWTPTYPFGQGIYLCAAGGNTIQNNNIHDNHYNIAIWGMNCGPSATSGAGNQILDNDIKTATGVGIYGGRGVQIFGSALEAGYAATQEIHNNDIVGNANYGVRNTDSGIADAENNWWGACDGPSGAGLGSGDAVSANVDYDPWTGCLARVSGMKFDDVNGNGVNDTEPGLEGWTIYGAEEVETLSVDSSNGAGMTTSNILGIGESYLVRVSGTYTAGDSITADAKYSVRPPNALWTDSVQNYEVYGPALLDLQIDGASPNWGSYNANHVYWYPLTGAGATLNFKVNDIYYPGNSGFFTVTLYKVLGQTLTGSDGTYSFSFTSYVNQIIVAEETQMGWTQTAPMPDGYYTLTPPGSFPDLNFGNFRYGTIEGMKYEDMNNNGVHDEDEPGLEGWNIKLTPTNPVGPAMTYLTNLDGTYSFVNLVPGEYFVEETPQTNWFKSEPSAAGYTVTISTSGQIEQLNFGNYRLGALYGVKFKDVNGNGVKDVGEPGMSGWTITLNPGNLTTTTGAGGAYAFTDLTPGIYELTEIMQPGWWQTLPGDTGIQEVFVHSGENLGSVDFGNFQLGKIVGAKYNDRNKNKRYDLGEPGLPGWRIQLINLQNGQQQYTTTGAGGLYQFADLKPGRYILREILQPKWIPTFPAGGIYNPVIISVSGDVQTRNFLNYELVPPVFRRR